MLQNQRRVSNFQRERQDSIGENQLAALSPPPPLRRQNNMRSLRRESSAVVRPILNHALSPPRKIQQRRSSQHQNNQNAYGSNGTGSANTGGLVSLSALKPSSLHRRESVTPRIKQQQSSNLPLLARENKSPPPSLEKRSSTILASPLPKAMLQKNNYLERLGNQLLATIDKQSTSTPLNLKNNSHLTLTPQPHQVKGEKVRDLSPKGSSKTPFQPRLPGNGFSPSSELVASSSTTPQPFTNQQQQKQAQNVYKRRFVLEIDSQLLTDRQNPQYIGNYYKRVIDTKIVADKNPLLKEEQTRLFMEQLKENSLKEILKVNHPQAQRQANLQRSMLSHRNAANNSATALQNSQKSPTAPFSPLSQKSSSLQVENQVAHVAQKIKGQSRVAAEMNELSKMISDLKLGKMSNIPDAIDEKSELLLAQENKSVSGTTTQNQYNITSALLVESSNQGYYGGKENNQAKNKKEQEVLDPEAGNNIVQNLNKRLKEEANKLIGQQLDNQDRKRAIMRRKRKLAINENPMWNLENMTKKLSKPKTDSGSHSLSSKSSLNDRDSPQNLLEKAFIQDLKSEKSGAKSSKSQEKSVEIIPFDQKGYMQKNPETRSESRPDSVESRSFDWLAKTNVFNLIKDELDALEDEFEREEIDKSQLEKLKQMSQYSKKSQRRLSIVQYKKENQLVKNWHKDEDAFENPNQHMLKIKAKIQLKVEKKYQEDLIQAEIERKKKEEQRSLEQAALDRYGRLVEHQGERKTKMMARKPREINRPPVKVQPPKRKQSFTSINLLIDMSQFPSPVKEKKGPTLFDKKTQNFMIECDRWPIPESLIGRTKGIPYELAFDTLMRSCYNLDVIREDGNANRQDLDVPFNSMESEDDFPVYDSQDSDEVNEFGIKIKDLKKDPSLADKMFDLNLLNTTPFRVESFKYFPYKQAEGEIPLQILKTPKLSYLGECTPALEAQQAEGKNWTNKIYQSIFEHYCIETKCAQVRLAQFYDFTDEKHPKINLNKFQMDDGMVKAVSLTMPFLHGFTDLSLFNNQMTDSTVAAILFAFFVHPTLNRLTIAYNYLRTAFSRTFSALIREYPSKIFELNLMGSVSFPDHLDPIVRDLHNLQYLSILNLAGCGMTHRSCRLVAYFIKKSEQIRTIDVAHCQINFQGTRYLIDAVSENQTIRNFLFSNNSLVSKSYEFSIKVAALLSRHASLTHLDIAHCGLGREEVIFIVIALSTSKAMLSLHVTSPGLTYYDRVYIRSVISARVSFQFRNQQASKKIKGNTEKNQVMNQLDSGTKQQPMLKYVHELQELEEKRQGLDYEIQDLLAEVDTQATFEDLPPEVEAKELPQGSKVQTLVDKLVERQKEIEAQQAAVKEFYSDETRKSLDDQVKALEGIKALAMENAENFGKQEKHVRKAEDEEDNVFNEMQRLRVERARTKAETQINKEGGSRSAGELALMFMGINQVAYELLLENPMTGYMNDVIFSRILGYDEIEEGAFWIDTTSCWVCGKWSKQTIEYDLIQDKQVFQQKVDKIETLNRVINSKVEAQWMSEKRKQKEQALHEQEQDDLDLIRAADKVDQDSFIVEAPAELEGGSKISSDLGATKHKMTGLNSFRPTTSQFGVTKQRQAAILEQTHSTMHGPKSVGGDPKDQDRDQSDGQLIKEVNFNLEQSDPNQSSLDQQGVNGEERGGIGAGTRNQSSHTGKPFSRKGGSVLKNPLGSSTQEYQIVTRKLVLPENVNHLKPFEYFDVNADDLYDELDEQYDLPVSYNAHTKINVSPIQMHGYNNSVGGGGADSSGKGGGAGQQTAQSVSTQDITNRLQQRYGQSRAEETSYQPNTSEETPVIDVISTHESRRRKRGEPVIIQRQVFFEGVVYQIEEELYSDSDHSSVYTSEDSFDENRNIVGRYIRQNKIRTEEDIRKEKEEKENSDFFGLMKRKQSRLKLNDSTTSVTTPQSPGTGTPQSPKSSTDKNTTSEDQSPVKTPFQRQSSSMNLDENKQDPSKGKAGPLRRQSTIKVGDGKSKEAADGKKSPVKRKSSVKLSDKDLKGLQKGKSKLSLQQVDEENEYDEEVEEDQEVNFGNILEQMKVKVYVNDPDLTEEQKEYEQKHGPKHYNPVLSERRIEKYTKVGKDLQKEKAGDKPVEEELDAEKLMPPGKNIKICASWNDWAPQRMKTRRQLAYEKFAMAEDLEEIPKRVWKADNVIALYCNYLPPGYHYFYLVSHEGSIFLSPKFDVIQFKNTNFFVNRVFVQKRLEEIETVFVLKVENNNEEVFMKERSIFKDFKEDTEDHLQQCFEEDMQFAKIQRTIRKGDVESEFKKIKDTLWKHYAKLLNIYKFELGTASTYPTISMNDFTAFGKKTKIIDEKNVLLANMDLLLVATNVSTHSYKNNAERDLQRYEFYEIIVRIANFRYKEKNIVKTTSQAIEKLLSTYIYPNARSVEPELFRKKQCYNVGTNEIMQNNDVVLRKIYDSHTNSKKKYITLEECSTYLRKVDLDVSEKMVGMSYVESMMTVVDTVRDQMRPNMMKYVEFVVFICRVSFEHFKGTQHENEPLSLKIDNLLPKFCAPLYLEPAFTNGLKFKGEIARMKEKLKRRQRRLKRHYQAIQKTKKEVDESLEEQVKQLQDDIRVAMGKKPQFSGQEVNLLEGMSDESTGKSEDDLSEEDKPKVFVDLTEVKSAIDSNLSTILAEKDKQVDKQPASNANADTDKKKDQKKEHKKQQKELETIQEEKKVEEIEKEDKEKVTESDKEQQP